jgi:hypothetical protein
MTDLDLDDCDDIVGGVQPTCTIDLDTGTFTCTGDTRPY